MTHHADIETIRHAFKMGAELAKAIKVGDVFLGAWPAADALGFAASTLERSARRQRDIVYSTYSDGMPDGFWAHENI